MLHRTVLDNGLRVLVQPTDTAPLASIHLWIDVGTADERPGEHGAAHFLEHMLFKGTARRGVGEAASVVEGLGGDLNAYTSHDQTVLHATVQATAWREALDVLVDMALHSTFDPDEFERERGVVLEEIRSYADDPESVLDDVAQELLFPDHAYGRPILGTLASIQAMRRDDLVGFWRRCYVPGRAVLGVAGDVDPDEVIEAARALLGGWAGSSDDATPDDAPAFRGPLVRCLPHDFRTRSVQLGWRAPHALHDDIPALDVLVGALGEGASSVLVDRLQYDDAVASDVYATLAARRVGGFLGVGFNPREGRTGDAVDAALDEIGRIARRGLPGVHVQRARDAILADFLFAEETVDGVAHDLCWYAARFGDPDARERYRAQVAAVTAADVRRVAARWLSPDGMAAVVLDKGTDERALSRRIRNARPAGRARATGPTRRVLDNGAVVQVLPDSSPVVAVRVAGLGGSLAEVPRTAGLSTAWARMVTAGAGDHDVTGFNEALDALAGTLEGVSGRNSLGIRATFPAEHVVDGLDLVGAVLTEPWFDTEEWERVVEEMRDDLDSVQDHPGQVASQVLWNQLWRGHPWRLPRTGTAASLGRIGPRALSHLHDRLVTGGNVVVAVAGGVDPDEVVDALSPWLEELPAGPPDLAARDLPSDPVRGARVRRAGREQVHVVFGARSVALDHPDRYPLELAAGVLGAQGGRLFMSLREREGLAYSVWAQSIEGVDGGVFAAGLATDPDRATDARKALRAELRRLLDAPPTDDEIARCRRMLAGQAAMGLQRAAGRAADAALGQRYGVPWGLEAYRHALSKVTPDAVRGAVERVLSGGMLEITVEPVPS